VSKLFGYDFTVEFKPGSQNVVADALSRREEDAIELQVHALSSPDIELFAAFRTECATSPDILAKRAEITSGTARASWSLVNGFVMHRGRIFVPPSSAIWPQILDAAHGAGHEGVEKTLHRLRVSFYNPHANRLVRDHVKSCSVCQRNKTEHLHPGTSAAVAGADGGLARHCP